MQAFLFDDYIERQNEEDDQQATSTHSTGSKGTGGEHLVATVLKTAVGRVFKMEFAEPTCHHDLRATDDLTGFEMKLQVKTDGTGARGNPRCYQFNTSRRVRRYKETCASVPYNTGDFDAFAYVAFDKRIVLFEPFGRVATTTRYIPEREFTRENEQATLNATVECILAQRRRRLAVVPRDAATVGETPVQSSVQIGTSGPAAAARFAIA